MSQALSIRLMNPEKIARLSHGEVTKSYTVNAKDMRPVLGGLCCPRTFGPVERNTCHCGKYKNAYKRRGHICEECGVEIGDSTLRRKRFGRISLTAPVAHVLFRQYIARILNIPPRQLQDISNYQKYIVLKKGESDYDPLKVISFGSYIKAKEIPGFSAGTGAEVLRLLLKGINLQRLAEKLKESKPSRRKNARLKTVYQFIHSGVKPEWMILDAILVMPPDLRPVMNLQDGTTVSSDLNELYARVIIRNNRLKKFIFLRAPEVMINIQKAGLQQAVDALFSNKKTCTMTDRSGKRALKSIMDNLKGKDGRFRRNIHGKRVDFSGRSQITAGPNLKLHQCELPVPLAIDIARPFIYNELLRSGYATTLKQARKLVEMRRPEVMEALERVFEDRMVLLNRAPTLHRMSIQAFDPVIVEGSAIRLHPLVCAAYNADFDGDQMGVHLPLSPEAQLEARVLMSSVNNIFSPASGVSLVTPTQDALFGLYYVTKERAGCKGEGMIFSDREDVITAYQHDVVDLHAKIKMRHNGEIIDTTPGRVILSEILPDAIEFRHINKLLKKKDIGKLIELCYEKAGHKETVILVDKLKDMGFKYATLSGLSICTDDMTTPREKPQIIREAEEAVRQIEEGYQRGNISDIERYNSIIALWSKASVEMESCTMRSIGIPQDSEAELLTEDQKKELREFSSMFMMADSGARGNTSQINHAAGMCGLMPKPSGEILEIPIKSSLKEGLSYHEYLLLVHKARKGRIDGPMNTPLAGYFTRRLVYAMHDVVIEKHDCGTDRYIQIGPLYDDNDEIIADIPERISGRIAARDIIHPETREVIARKGSLINRDTAQKAKDAELGDVAVRSPLTCEAKKGVCALCYGMDLSIREMAVIGDAVGIIAAQSIGEPGTQLTLRTFHSSGASVEQKKSSITAKHNGIVAHKNIKTIKNRHGKQVVIGRNGFLSIISGETEKGRWKVPYGAILEVGDHATVRVGETIATWDPMNTLIISTAQGKVDYRSIISGVTVRVEDVYGIPRKIVSSVGKDAAPAIVVGGEEFALPVGAHISVEKDDLVEKGDVLAKIPMEASRNLDITSGLPKVLEILDIVKPKERAIIAEIDGYVSIQIKNGKYIIEIDNRAGDKRKYTATLDSVPSIYNGDYVDAGDVLVAGTVDLADIIHIYPREDAAIYVVNEVQKIYKSQGVGIHDKHFEILTRKMTGYVEITDSGNTESVQGDIITLKSFLDENNNATGRPATAKPVILGLSDITYNRPSWVAAASYQKTASTLAEAAISGSSDPLEGLQENIIASCLIPVGTGHHVCKNTSIITKKRPGRPRLAD